MGARGGRRGAREEGGAAGAAEVEPAEQAAAEQGHQRAELRGDAQVEFRTERGGREHE